MALLYVEHLEHLDVEEMHQHLSLDKKWHMREHNVL